MGRFIKTVLGYDGIDKRQYGYYSTPDFIAKFITDELININPNGKKVLDPAAGNEELLAYFFQVGKQIDSLDIRDFGNYRYSRFQQINFIDFLKKNTTALDYDYYIANPPYNCHEINYIRDNKDELKVLFADVGTHNMYSMFLGGLIDLAKEGALIGVIVSDSFLNATAHAGLRKKILDQCSIHLLLLCPTDLFWDQEADVRTCIIILQKGKQYQRDVRVGDRLGNRQIFQQKLLSKNFETVNIKSLTLAGLNQFIIGVPKTILKLFDNPKLGEIFNCITGISTGNDKKYLSKTKKFGFTVPFYKNPGKRKFYTEPDAYLVDDFWEVEKKAKDFLIRNRKFIFKEGITCSSMGLPFSACYLPENSTFGVNANIFGSRSDIYWLMGYLNSSLVTYFVRGVLIRSNMITSGYVSRIPIIPLPESIKIKLAEVALSAMEKKTTHGIEQIDQLIFDYLQLNQKDIALIGEFSRNLSKRV